MFAKSVRSTRMQGPEKERIEKRKCSNAVFQEVCKKFARSYMQFFHDICQKCPIHTIMRKNFMEFAKNVRFNLIPNLT